MKFVKEHFFLLGILFLGAVLRLFLLGIVPFGVTHDELGYIFNAYSIALTGKNVFGQTLPFLTWMVKWGFPFMPVPIYLAAPLYWIFPLSATTGRLMGALLGIGDVLLLFILVIQLTKNKPLALLSALFLAISPWHIHLSRTAYDPNYAVFFYLVGIVIFLFEIQKKRLPIFSFISFLLAVFSYRGMSIFGLPLLFFLLGYARIVWKASRRQVICICVGIAAILVLLAATIAVYGHSYTAEGQTLFTDPKIAEEIITQSRDAKGPLIIKRIFLNKLTVIAQHFTQNYLDTFSPDFLFIHGEGNPIYSMWMHGKLYLMDLPFLLLGFGVVFAISQSVGVFLLVLLLLAALPGGVGGQPYSARDLFLSVIFPIFIASGIWWIFQQKRVKRFALLVLLILIIGYLFALGNYLFDYYGVYAYQGAESWAKSLKDVSNTILSQGNTYQHIIVGPTSHGDFIQFAFYAHLSPQEVQKVWRKSRSSYAGPFVYKNITFVSSCPSYQKKQNSLLVITRGNCYSFAIPKERIRDYWGNPIWNIYSY